jgi:hypothetical protein
MTSDKPNGYLALGLEELVVVLNLLGYAEVAKGVLISHLGEMNPDEERGRLLAANHSLMAKDILYLQGNSIRMEEGPARLLGFLITNDYAVRGTARSKNGDEESLTYYVRNQSVVEQRITHGVVYAFQESTLSAAVDALASFMLPAGGDAFQSPSFTLGNEQLEQAQLLIDAEGAEAGQAFFRRLQVPEAPAAYLAEDLSQPTLRSAAMQVTVDMNAGISADHGYLILGSATGRAWAMDIRERNGAGELIVQPATEKQVGQLTKALFNHH